MPKNIVIVGGVAGGASTAVRLRRLDEHAEITILEKGRYVSFANCGLPYFVGDVIQEQSSLELMTPELFLNRFNISVKVNNDALSIDPKNKTIKVLDHSNGRTYDLEYDSLVLSPGASPIKPPIPGSDQVDLFTVRTIPDSAAIKSYIQNRHVKRVVVIGGGFIGVEMAENIRHLGVNTTIVEMVEQVMMPFDLEMAQFIHQELIMNGVELVLRDGVDSFSRSGKTQIVKTKSGRKIETDMIILAIGVSPDSKLAREAGLAIGPRGHIIVDSHMRTSDDAIYAVGDAVQIKHFITGDDTMLPLAGPANRQGRIAADNIAGRNSSFKGVIGTAIVKVFGITAACTGINEKSLAAEGKIKYDKVYLHPNNHAGYYPGAATITMKLIYEKENGKILGAQAIGADGPDKRIDIISALIQKEGTVFDMEEMELCYAPPFGSAKDPVNMAGFVAANVIKKDVSSVHWSEIDDLREKGAFILDVRTNEEFSLGHVAGAVNIPDTELRNSMHQIPHGKPVMVYCRVGFRGYLAARVLTQKGYTDVRNLSGGFKLYQIAHAPLSSFKLGAAIPVSENEKTISRLPDDTIHPSNIIIEAGLDCSGLQCPGPIIKLAQKMKEMSEGSLLKITATDPGFASDLPAWCRSTGNELLSLEKKDNLFQGVVKKSVPLTKKSEDLAQLPDGKAIILFSGALDKALAAFIIANGAAAMGRKVTIFATFWGLSVLKKDSSPPNLKKTLIQEMFGFMLPRGAKKLALSQMNMAGIGSAMIKGIMKSSNVDSLPVMIDMAIKAGVNIVACQMSMDLMGVKHEELLDGVQIGGVASFLEAAESADTTLFIG
jgi:NADPH-dependent 2,4-dienoyl-CoA reductase/sulfur reductase-like enzyme/peroxiredoxin family protein/rhodanese-related sulfurtransferase/TusA-related sulfurtransferase